MARYDLHLLLNANTSKERLSAVTRAWGSKTSNDWSVVSSERFEQRLNDETFALFWDDPDRVWPNEEFRDRRIQDKDVTLLSTRLFPDLNDLNLISSHQLSLEPMASPILNSNNLSLLGEDAALKAEKMRKIFLSPSTKSGVFSYRTSPKLWLDKGLFYCTTQSYEPSNEPDGTKQREEDLKRFEKVDVMLHSVIEILEPYYAFITSAREMDYVPKFDPSMFPPVEPWQYCWRMFVYGQELVAKLGRDYLLQTPAFYVKELKNGAIWIQPTDERYRDWVSVESVTLSEAQRDHYREAVRSHLQIMTPFT
jgi:hypothetical protein